LQFLGNAQPTHDQFVDFDAPDSCPPDCQASNGQGTNGNSTNRRCANSQCSQSVPNERDHAALQFG
jgi:hypothetical protein